jgi:hypothetical protein
MDRIEAALPDNLKQWVNVALAATFLLGVFLAVLAGAQRLNDDQFIGPEELKNSVQELESYSAEADQLHHYTLSDSAPRPYSQTYGSALQEATDSITQKLQEHPHADTIDKQVDRTISLSERLSKQLNRLSTEPHSQLPGANAFQSTSDKLQLLEQDI